MANNPYEPPQNMAVNTVVDHTRTRRDLAGVISAFLAGQISAFEFDDQLCDFEQSDDPTMRFVTSTVWCYYDDWEDHDVCLSKSEWDLFQRLLLLLSSDCRIDIKTKRIWSARQLIAGTSLGLFTCLAFYVGWGRHLLLLSVPFGLISVMLAYLFRTERLPDDPWQPVIYPFATLSDLERAYRKSGFRKTRYPKKMADRTIRPPSLNAFYRCYWTVIWLLLAPIVLFVQSFPETQMQCHATAN